MDLLTPHLENLRSQVAALVAECSSARAFQRATEHELAAQLDAIATVHRLVEAMLVDATGEVMRRSEGGDRDERMTSHLGCRDVTELVEQITRVSAQTAARLQRAAKATRPEISDISGELLEAPFPSVRDAMTDGVIGVDGILSITEPLQQTAPRVTRDARRQAADVVVAEARGEGPDGAPPACAALLKIHAQTWSIALDQDGAEPRERAAIRKRALVLGVPTPTGVPIRGMLLPEIAAQLQTIWDAQLSPKVSFDDPAAVDENGDLLPLPAPDDRTRAQKQHDAFAAALGVAASSGLLPTIGGYAPTLVVSVDGRRSRRRYRVHARAGMRGADLGHRRPAHRLRRADSAHHDPEERQDRRDRHRRTGLQPPPAPRDRPPRRWMHHSRLRDSCGMVRDPPRHGIRQRRQNPHRQRRLTVLVPPPIPRPDRLADPDERRGTRSQAATLARNRSPVARRHNLTRKAEETSAHDVIAARRPGHIARIVNGSHRPSARRHFPAATATVPDTYRATAT